MKQTNCSCLVIFSIGYLLFAQVGTFGQTAARSPEASLKNPAHHKRYSKLAIELSTSTKFEIKSEKSEFRKGDIIHLDATITNLTDRPLLLLDLTFGTEIFLLDSEGKRVSILLNGIPEFRLSPAAYRLVASGHAEKLAIVFSIGCKGIKKTGRGCFAIEDNGKFSIAASVKNRWVVFSKKQKTSTGVGRIEGVAVEFQVH